MARQDGKAPGSRRSRRKKNLADAIAEHFGVTVENLTGFVITAEFHVEDGTTIRTVPSINLTPWAARGFIREAVKHGEKFGVEEQS